MKNRTSLLVAISDAGKSTDDYVGANLSASPRALDAPTSTMFANIHINKERFCVAAVGKAFANIRTTMPG
jgi:hypothetical protein